MSKDRCVSPNKGEWERLVNKLITIERETDPNSGFDPEIDIIPFEEYKDFCEMEGRAFDALPHLRSYKGLCVDSEISAIMGAGADRCNGMITDLYFDGVKVAAQIEFYDSAETVLHMEISDPAIRACIQDYIETETD